MIEYIPAETLAQNAKTEYQFLQSKMEQGPLSPKDRMAILQQEMPVQEPKKRASLMSEVAIGYTAEQAIL